MWQGEGASDRKEACVFIFSPKAIMVVEDGCPARIWHEPLGRERFDVI